MRMTQANPYIMAEPDSLPLRIIAMMRRRMYASFLKASAIKPEETLLDVGVTGVQDYESFNYLEAWYPHKNKITAVGLDDASYLETLYPGVTFRQANGLELPFADASFDVVHSSAVLEHVGSFSNQERFVAELVRVARRGVFITTPNRWFIMELHTVLPVIHWLPKTLFRWLLRGTRYDFYTHEENLNLLDKRELKSLVPAGCRFRVMSVSPLVWPASNLLLWIEKASAN